MFFAAPTERHQALLRVPELADLAEQDETVLADALAQRFAMKSVADWVAIFAGSPVGVVPLGSLHGTRDAALQLESAGDMDIATATYRAVRHDHHPMGRWVDLVAPNAVRPRNARITIAKPAPKYGCDTMPILQRLGYTESEIRSMIDNGAAAESWSDKYLPE